MSADEVDVRGPNPKPQIEVIDLESEPAWFCAQCIYPQ